MKTKLESRDGRLAVPRKVAVPRARYGVREWGRGGGGGGGRPGREGKGGG